MELLTTHLQEGSPPVLHVQGEIDMATADHLREAIERGLTLNSKLVVDMTEVTFIDVMGLRALLDAASLTQDGPLTLVNAPVVSWLLALTEMTDISSVQIRNGTGT